MTQPPLRPTLSQWSSPAPPPPASSGPPSSSTPIPPPKAPLVWRKRLPLSFSPAPYHSPALFTPDGLLRSRYQPGGASTPAPPPRVKALVDTGDRRPSAAPTSRPPRPLPPSYDCSGQWGDAEGWGGWADAETVDLRAPKSRPPPARRPLPHPPPSRPSPSPLLSPPLLTLTLRYLATAPLPQPCHRVTRGFYAELRLRALRAPVMAASHGHLSLKSLCLLAQLDLLEDCGEARKGRAGGGGVAAPQLHRSLVGWAMMALGLTEASAASTPGEVERWLLTLYDEVTEEEGGKEGAEQGRRYRAMREEEEAVMAEIAEPALRQWRRATAEHNRLQLKPSPVPPSGPSPPTPIGGAPLAATAVVAAPVLFVKASLPPVTPPSHSAIASASPSPSSLSSLRRYPSGSEVREQARADLAYGQREAKEAYSPSVMDRDRRATLGPQRSSQGQRAGGGLQGSVAVRSASFSMGGGVRGGGGSTGGVGRCVVTSPRSRCRSHRCCPPAGGAGSAAPAQMGAAAKRR